MDTRLEALATEHLGVFTYAAAMERGVPRAELRKALRKNEIRPLRRGSYVLASAWDSSAGAEDRYLLKALAIVLMRPFDMLSHHAALAAHGLPLWNVNLDRFDVVSSTDQVTGRGELRVHPGVFGPAVECHGVRVVPVARAVVRTAVTMGRDAAVVAGDAALHRGLVTVDELLAEVSALTPHQGRQRAFDAVALMDGASESVGETRLRLHVHDLGFVYRTQVEIRDETGELVGIVDLMVDDVAVEFDGKVKYSGRYGDGTQALWAEKRREDAIRRLGHPVERVVWDELDRPMLIGARINRAKRLVRTSLIRPA